MNLAKTLFLILLTLCLCGCRDIESIKNVDYIKVVKDKNLNSKTFHGMVKSQLKSDLSFQSEGKIIFLPYTKGDFVKKGQVLARLDGILYKIRKNEEEARLKEAKIEYNKSKSYYKRMDILHKEGAISDNDWEDAYFGLKTLGEKIKIQQEKINYLNREISYNIITAPYDGFISDKMSEVGSYAKIGVPVLTIMGNNKTQIETMVDSSIINDLGLNETVEITAGGNYYEGKIAHISKTSSTTGGYLIKIYLDGIKSELKDGMSADITIPIKNVYCAYIPLDCIFEENGEKFVYKIVNIKNNIGTVLKEKIKTGLIKDTEVEIIKGINDNDLIISGNLNKLNNNIKVRL